MPAHLRALDASVLEQAGRNTPSLIDQGMALVGDKNLGAAQMLWQAAQLEALPDREKFGEAVNDLARENPGLPESFTAEKRMGSGVSAWRTRLARIRKVPGSCTRRTKAASWLQSKRWPSDIISMSNSSRGWELPPWLASFARESSEWLSDAVRLPCSNRSPLMAMAASKGCPESDRDEGKRTVLVTLRKPSNS